MLLYACVHWLLLREPGHELRRWYPNLAADHPRGPITTDPYPVFRDFCHAHRDRLAELLATRTTQTNEIGRCALVVPALAQIAVEWGDLALIDVGTSAGLNLLLDRYGYRYDDDRSGSSHRLDPVVAPPTLSPDSDPTGIRPTDIELRCGTRGPVPLPESLPTIVDRRGLDRSPIDVTDDDEADWLRACIWPDQADRFERLDSALAMAALDPPEIVTGDAADDLADTLALLDTDAHPVVMHSWVLNYLGSPSRHRFVEVLDEIGSRRDLSWIAVESPALTAEIPWPTDIADPHLTHVVRVDWSQGHRRVAHLASAHPHGYWLHWSEGSEGSATTY